MDNLETSTLLKLYLDFNAVDEDAVDEGDGDENGSIYAKFVAPSSPLQLLSLRGNKITSSKASKLFENLRDNKTLMSLNLWGNGLTDPSMPELANALLVNKTLTHLSLSKNELSNEGAVSLMRCLTSEVVDKDEAKELKKAGIATTAVKGTTFRDPNTTLRVLNLGHNLIGDPGCLDVLYAINPETRCLSFLSLLLLFFVFFFYFFFFFFVFVFFVFIHLLLFPPPFLSL